MTRERSPGEEIALSPTLNAGNVRAERDVIIQQIINNTTIHQYQQNRRKRWRELEMFSYPTWNLERDISTNYPVHLIVALHRVFAKHGYTTFTSEVAVEDRENAEGPYQAITLISHQIRFVGELRMLLTSLWSDNRTREERQGIQEQENQESIALQKDWQLDLRFAQTKGKLPYEFLYDPDGRRIRISPHDDAPATPEEYPDKLQRTSELLLFLNALRRQNFLTFDISTVNHHYGLAKLFLDILDREPISLGKVRINVEDYEDWDYLNPQADLEFGRAFKPS